MLRMHVLFDLKDGSDEGSFHEALENFAAHMLTEDFIVGWELGRRHPHAQFDNTTSTNAYLAVMEFDNRSQADAAIAYIHEHKEPTQSLHSDVFSRVRDAQFLFYEQV